MSVHSIKISNTLWQSFMSAVSLDGSLWVGPQDVGYCQSLWNSSFSMPSWNFQSKTWVEDRGRPWGPVKPKEVGRLGRPSFRRDTAKLGKCRMRHATCGTMQVTCLFSKQWASTRGSAISKTCACTSCYFDELGSEG